VKEGGRTDFKGAEEELMVPRITWGIKGDLQGKREKGVRKNMEPGKDVTGKPAITTVRDLELPSDVNRDKVP